MLNIEKRKGVRVLAQNLKTRLGIAIFSLRLDLRLNNILRRTNSNTIVVRCALFPGLVALLTIVAVVCSPTLYSEHHHFNSSSGGVDLASLPGSVR